MLILYILLGIALLGTCSSTVFLGLVLLGARKFRAEARTPLDSLPDEAHLPPVSVLKPVHGLEARLQENLESFFRQEYPDYEILFAADEAEDAALPVIRAICARYPQVRSRVLVTGRPPWPNPPAYCFHRMTEVAAHDILVTSDSDVEVSPRYLREVVPPLLDPAVGMVTCPYRGKNAGGFWSGQDAIGMSVEMTAGVLVANLLEGMKFGLGPTIAVRKDALARIGGYAAVGDYYMNDFMLGNLIHHGGFHIVLSSHVIDHVSPPMTLRMTWQRWMRWAVSTRQARPKGHFGTGLVFAMPYGILGFAAAMLLGHPGWAALLLALAVANRTVEAYAVGWGVVRDPRARRAPWFYPVRDLLGFVIWGASYLSRRSVWRDSKYEVLAGGRVAMRQSAGNEQPQ